MNKTFKISILVLVTANLAVLIWMLLSPPKPPFREKKSPKEKVIKHLNFDESQVVQYEKLIDEQRENFHELQHNLHKKKDRLHQLLKHDSLGEEEVSSAIENIAKVHIKLETLHFEHLKKIKNLCTPVQQQEFNRMMDEVDQIFGSPLRPKPPHQPRK